MSPMFCTPVDVPQQRKFSRLPAARVQPDLDNQINAVFRQESRGTPQTTGINIC